MSKDLDTLKREAKAILDKADGDLTGEDAQRFDELTTEIESARAEVDDRAERAAEVLRLARSGDALLESGSIQPIGNTTERRRTGPNDLAMRSLDEALSANRLQARGAELVESLLNNGPAQSRAWTAQYAVAAGSVDYERAFAKLVGDPERGHLLWTSAEQDAYRQVEHLRAMSLTDSAGGFMVPLTLDPAVLLTSNGSVNPLRQISRVVQISTDSWNGITSAGVSAEWIAEATEVAAVTPTLTQPTIPVYKADAYCEFSVELAGDATNLMSELGKILTDAADQLTATAYTVGSGSGQPTGIITALVAASTPIVTGDGSEVLAASDPYKLQNALAPRWQPNAVWNASLPVLNTFRQMETTNGSLKFPGLQGNPPSLLGRTMHENSNMDSVIHAAATEANYLLLYGAFQQFVIVDRVGSTLELIPHVMGSNRRPTLQRGALLWFRTGSNATVPAAFKLLNVATTA